MNYAKIFIIVCILSLHVALARDIKLVGKVVKATATEIKISSAHFNRAQRRDKDAQSNLTNMHKTW